MKLNGFTKRFAGIPPFFLLAALLIFPVGILMDAQQADAAGVKYSDGDKYVKFGGRIQAQYHIADPDEGDSTDEAFFRRLRPYVEGSVHKDWKGKFQIDYGKSDVAIKDAYLRYTGFDDMEISVGNQNFPFSRELLTSSKYQQLVERTFVGDHNYGTPDRQLGVHLTGEANDSKITYGFSLANACIDPDDDKIDFDTAVNNDASDWNEGWMLGGRVDFHPFGKLKFSQGDFKGKTLATIGIAAFTWSNDDDNLGHEADLESVTGFELSAAYRGGGFSIDAQYNIFNAETVDAAYTSGMYSAGETEMTNYAVEGGYMLVPSTFEVVAGYQSMDADNYDDAWTRTSIGANYYFQKHDIKIQTTYRMGSNLKGKADNDENEIFVQAQYVF